MIELAVRVVFSLAVILGLLWFIARTSSRKFGGTARSAIKVVARQQLARTASLAVVEVGDRVLVVGVSEHGVNLLTEMDPSELPEPVVAEPATSAQQTSGSVVRAARSILARRPAESPATRDAAVQPVSPVTATRRATTRAPGLAAAAVTGGNSAVLPRPQGPTALSGSVLSVQTWRQAWAAATRSNGIASD